MLWQINGVKENNMSGIELILSDRNGVYIPKYFVEQFADMWEVSYEDSQICALGPDVEDNEFYWDAWQTILDSAIYRDEEGKVWRLWQDGDLWAYCEELMTNEEYLDFFGEERIED
jgi:hypothetical protein